MTEQKVVRELTENQQRMVGAVSFLEQYMSTYSNQQGFEDYTDQIYIDDILYGLGASLDQTEYQYHGGYMKFLQRLQKHIAEKLEKEGPESFTKCQLGEKVTPVEEHEGK